MSTPTVDTSTDASRLAGQRRKATIAGSAGMFIEFYEFGVYGAMAPIIATVFFPADTGFIGLLATWAIFGVTFFVRPLGGFVLGVLGDKLGRKTALLLSILIITIATTLIGLTPGYAAIGVAAPILLLLFRLAQGFSAGGEVSAAMTFVGEHADPKRRAFAVSFVQSASFVALLCGTGLGIVLTSLLDDQAMHDWGWRIPFLLSLPLGLFGLWLRRSIGETEVFQVKKETGNIAVNPAREMMSTASNRRNLWIAMLLPVLNGVGYYVVYNYLPTYLSTSLGFTSLDSFIITSVGLLALCIAVPFAAIAADRWGRRTVLLISAVAMAVLTFPAYGLMQNGTMAWAIAGIVGLSIFFAGQTGVIHTALLEMFPAAVRTTAYSVGYNIGLAIFGGAGPLVVTSLIGQTGNNDIVAFYVIGAAVVTFVCGLFMAETKARSLHD
ncbi:MFS transporter [Gulosibacter sp. 10]|uniref:MFS transporter n=1 Tax=Gulosibacter sp. 10 TaxID=1255570 RepID=UPI00097EE03A|nr:MFS transporter [Gulosibacter sp. 10]SJM62667.1 L-Proline/Glycine betaine transporter ProP [Gulosibacter sp. 10]